MDIMEGHCIHGYPCISWKINVSPPISMISIDIHTSTDRYEALTTFKNTQHIYYIYIYIYIRFFYQRSQILSDSHSTCNLACCTNNYATFFFDCHPTVDFNRAPMQIKRTLAAKSRANANHEPKVGRTKIKFL